MKQLTFLLLISVFALTACNQGSDSDDGTSTTNQTVTPAEKSVPDVNPPHGEPGHVHEDEIPVNPPHGEPGHVHGDDEGFGTDGEQGDVRLNPPHGEPGHRCEIAVGAPLPKE